MSTVSANSFFINYIFVFAGMEHYPESQSGRCLLVSWWLFTIIMSATYTANLVAYITVNISGKPISTLQELADHPNVIPIILPGNSLNDLFSVSISGNLYY